MALDAQVLTRAIGSSALVVTALKARWVASWCDRSKLARLPCEVDSGLSADEAAKRLGRVPHHAGELHE